MEGHAGVDGGGASACCANGSVDRSCGSACVGESRWGRQIPHGAAWLMHVNESHVVHGCMGGWGTSRRVADEHHCVKLTRSLHWKIVGTIVNWSRFTLKKC